MINVANTENLSVNEQYALITDVQTGSPAADAAWARLTEAFAPAVRAAARSTKLKNNEEDAEATAWLAFSEAVMAYDLTADTPFHHIVPNVMRRAVRAQDRQDSAQASIPDVQVKRYFRAYNENGQDVAAAYRQCQADPTRWLLTGEAFAALHYAIHGSASMDAPSAHAAEAVGGLGTYADPAEQFVTRDHVRWLLAQVSDRQELICRLKYGFEDLDTENLSVMLAKGYRPGDVLEDLQVADVLGMSRATVQRQRNDALKTMRAAEEKEITGE